MDAPGFRAAAADSVQLHHSSEARTLEALMELQR